MSHFTRVKTKIIDITCLIEALADVGYAEVEQGTALSLYGYQGDKRPQTAEVVIRRQHVGSASNDIGFMLTEDGTYEAIISEYDAHRHGKQWLDKLAQRYAYHVVSKEAAVQGYSAIEETVEKDGSIQMVYQRW